MKPAVTVWDVAAGMCLSPGPFPRATQGKPFPRAISQPHSTQGIPLPNQRISAHALDQPWDPLTQFSISACGAPSICCNFHLPLS